MSTTATPQGRLLDSCGIRSNAHTVEITSAPSRGSVNMSRTRFAAIATFMVLSCAGCSLGGSPSADPSTSPMTSSPTPTTATPTAVPAYLERFSAAERQAYADAVQAYKDFSDQQDTYMASGKATPEAKRFYRRNTADWQTFWATLRRWDRDDIRTEP